MTMRKIETEGGFKDYILILDGLSLVEFHVPYVPTELCALCLADVIDPHLDEAFWAYKQEVAPERLVDVIANKYGFAKCDHQNTVALALYKWASKRMLWQHKPGSVEGYTAEDINRRYKMKLYAIAEGTRTQREPRPRFHIDIIDAGSNNLLKWFDGFDIESAYREAQQYVLYLLRTANLRIAPGSTYHKTPMRK